MQTLLIVVIIALGQSAFSQSSCPVLSRIGKIWSAEQIVEDHGKYLPTNSDLNRQYLEALKSPESHIWGVLHVDLANLKWQNDKGMINKSMVDASENMFRKVLWDAIQTDPLLSYHLNYEFSDFKTSRFGFWEVPKEKQGDFESRLTGAVAKAGLAHSKYLRSYLGFAPEIQARLKKLPKDRLDSEPGAWHTAGFAFKETGLTAEESADLAALRARFAREDFQEGEKTIPLRLGNSGIVAALGEVQALRAEINQFFRADPASRELAIETIDGVDVPSRKVIEVLRKIPNHIRGDEIPAYLREKLKTALGLEVDDLNLLSKLHRFATLTDKFSPSINEVNRVIPRLEGDVVSIDIKGMGAVNLQELMAALGKVTLGTGEMDSVLASIRAARRSEQRATAWINHLKEAIREAGLNSHLTSNVGDIEFTGDDGAISVPLGLNPLAQEGFAKLLAANQFRVVMVRGKYSKNSRALSRMEKLGVINTIEAIEKRVQEKLGRRSMDIGFEIEPTTPGKGKVRLWVTGEKVSDNQLSEARRYVSQELPKEYELLPQSRVISSVVNESPSK